MTLPERETLWAMMNKTDDVPRELYVVMPDNLRGQLVTAEKRRWALCALREGVLCKAPLLPPVVARGIAS